MLSFTYMSVYMELQLYVAGGRSQYCIIFCCCSLSSLSSEWIKQQQKNHYFELH